MSICSFGGVIRIIAEQYPPGYKDLTDGLLCSYLNARTRKRDIGFLEECVLYDSEIDAMVKTDKPPSKKIVKYYAEQGERELRFGVGTVYKSITDPGRVAERLQDLVLHDDCISEKYKQDMMKKAPYQDDEDIKRFIAKCLWFGLNRDEAMQPINHKQMTLKHVTDGRRTPRPCRHFVGRKRELLCLEEELQKEQIVYVRGVPGIGKTQLVRKYAKENEEHYKDIIYLSYKGDWEKTLGKCWINADKRFTTNEERVEDHDQLLRTLSEDSLLIIDGVNDLDGNMEVAFEGYGCKVIVTTRCKQNDVCEIHLGEMDENELISLMEKFWKPIKNDEKTAEKIIHLVHKHTFAVELASRLLADGVVSMKELCRKLLLQKVKLSVSKCLKINRGEKQYLGTYYEQMKCLYSLCRLSEEEKAVLRGIWLMPKDGVKISSVIRWLDLEDTQELWSLIERGYMEDEEETHIIEIPAMTRELVEANLEININTCSRIVSKLLESILKHGRHEQDHVALEETMENVIALLRDDIKEVHYLENLFEFFRNYKHENGMNMILKRMEQLLENDLGTDYDLRQNRTKKI